MKSWLVNDGILRVIYDNRQEQYWCMVSTHLKNISQIGSFPQVGRKSKKYLKPPPTISVETKNSTYMFNTTVGNFPNCMIFQKT